MRASASATASSAMSSARACCCIWSTAQEDNAGKAYKTVRGELEAYGDGLAEKPEIVALNKVDALDADERKKKVAVAQARRRARADRCFRRSPARASRQVLRALIARGRRSARRSAADAAPADARWTN